MQKLVRDYLNEMKSQRKRRRNAGIAIILLAVMVIGGVAGILTQYGVAMTGQAKCGKEEHEHTASCYEKVLVCGQEEGEGHQHTEACYQTETASMLVCGQEESQGHTHTEACYQTESALICGQEESESHQHTEACYEEQQTLVCGQEESEGHTHTEECSIEEENQTLICGQEEGGSHTHEEACYEEQLICDKEEHKHTEICYIDAAADVETAEDWEAQYADVIWEDTWSENLVLAARVQLDQHYEESSDNYTISEDGTHKGYTRYGQFMEEPYADWDAAFVNFCLYYAGITESGAFEVKTDAVEADAVTEETETAKWHDTFEKAREDNGKYLTTEQGYTPVTGDLVFFRKSDEEPDEERMGIVSSYDEENGTITVIEGDSQDEVRENTYAITDESILGYLKTTELEEDIREENNKDPEEPEESQEPEGPTEEQQQQIDAVNGLLLALPTEEEIAAKQAELMGETDEDTEGWDAWLMELAEQVQAAYDAYLALPEELRQYLDQERVALLLQLQEMFGVMTLDEKEHNARITDFNITRTVDGTAPFDNHKAHTEKCYEVGHNGDSAYLTCKQHIYTDDGEASVPGDDRGADNLVVRTFDSVNYKFRVTMDTYATSGAVTEARVKLQVILPATQEQAAFNLEAMTWVDTTAGYEPEIEDIIRDENGGFRVATPEDAPESINGQLLTCWKHLESGRAVIPGFFENNVSVDVKSMKNGEVFAPTFYAVLEDGYKYDITDGSKVPQLTRGAGEDAKNPEKNSYAYTKDHKCPLDAHGEVEMFRADAPEIRVSAAPKYNIRMAGGDAEKRQYNFDDIQSGAQTQAANTGKGLQTGRMIRLGITLQLYNDNASKGLKGIQLPDENTDITFDLELKSEYQSHKTPQEEIEKKIDVTEEYTPLLWSCGPNDRDSSYGKTNIDGRVIYDGYWGSGLAPYSNGGGEYGCQESGTWTATQDGNKISVTVSGYRIDVTNMPSFNHGQDAEVDNATYGSHIGCFSSGVVWILQPFNKDAETDIEIDPAGNREPEFDVVNTYGEGVFHTTIDENNMQITTSDALDTIVVKNEAQMCKTDDRDTRNLELLLPGVMINRVRYSDKDISKGVGVASIRNGRDYASLGSEVWLMGGFTYYADRKEENEFYYGTNLMKFYGSAIEPLEDEPIDGWAATAEGQGGSYVPGHSHLQTYFSGGARASEIAVYYATKPDGSDWEDDYQMEHTYEDSLVFYKHMSDIPKDKLCVGILYCFKGSGMDVGQETNDPAYECFHRAVVKADDTLLGDGTKPVTYAIVSTSRVWTRKMCENRWGEGVTLQELSLPEWDNAATKLDDFPAGYIKSGNIQDSTWYERTLYYDDGRGVSKEHNSDWSHWGDTLLLIGYKTYITKNLMQKTGGEEKQIFDLDGNQRVVDFKLTPRTGYNLAISQGEGSNPNITIPVITIIDTLPKYLRYREGSAYLGGTYRQTAANGGRQGEIIGGTPLEAPEEETHTADGGETVKALAWNISKPSSAVDEPVIIESEDGTQTLIWRFYNREVGDKLPVIYYSADIGDRGNALTDVPEGTTNLINKVRITAKLDRRHPSKENENYAEVGIAVTKGAAGAYGKYSLQNAVEEDGIIDYVVYYDNNTDNDIAIALMDNMPFNGINGNKFTGTYKLTGWKLDQSLCEKSELQIWYTTDTRYKELTLSDKDSQKNPVITIDEVHGWKKAEVAEDGTLSCPELNFETLEFGKEDGQFLAWAVTGKLEGGNCVDISMSIQLIPEKPTVSDSVTREIYHYVNLFSTKDTITEIDTPTVRRTLEGLTWMDYNRNGKQDQHQNEDEDQLPGVQVTLLKMTDAPEGTSEKEWAKDISHYEPVVWPEGTEKAGQNVTISTGQQISLRQSDCEAVSYENGRYKFTDLPAGYFAVEFTPGEGAADISKMRATIYDCMGNTADQIDSDGVPVYTDNDEKNGRLEQTYIGQIEMESADTIFYNKYPNYTQTSPYHDSGFYYNAEMMLHKVGENWKTALKGAVFTLADSNGQTITFNRGEDGSYILPTDLGDGIVTGARYYIQYNDASNTNGETYVIGTSQGEIGNGAWMKLFKKRAGDDTQLFELFAQTDGSFSFRHCASGRWIDLSGGNTADETAIHLWEDVSVPTTNPNQKWYVTANGNDQYRIQGYAGRQSNTAFVDLSSNTVAEGQRIWGYTGNWTTAQNWRLVPENNNSNLEVDSNGKLVITDLIPGDYTLAEIKVPDGCSMPPHPTQIRVNKDGTIEVIGENPNNVMAKNDPSNQEGSPVQTDVWVKNNDVYRLPSAGGVGIYWYLIGGVLLMGAGALIQYKKKRVGRC